MIISIIIKLTIFDVAVPGDKRIGEKENEKVKSQIARCGTRQLSKLYLWLWDYEGCSKELCNEQQGLCFKIVRGPIKNYSCIRSLIKLRCLLTFCRHCVP